MKKTSLDLSVKKTQMLAQNAASTIKEIERALSQIEKSMAQERRGLRNVSAEDQKSNTRLFELLGNKQALTVVLDALNKGDFQGIKTLT